MHEHFCILGVAEFNSIENFELWLGQQAEGKIGLLSLTWTFKAPFSLPWESLSSLPLDVLHYPTLGSCQILEREFGLTTFALCLFIMSEDALKVATFESVAVLVWSRPVKCSVLLMFIHIWTKPEYFYMVLILKSLKWYLWFLLLVESSIAVLTWANLPVRSTQILPKEKV